MRLKSSMVLPILALVLLTVTECQASRIQDLPSDTGIRENVDNLPKNEPTIKRLLDGATEEIDKIREGNQINERPMIGIFTQPYNETNDYIMASYVKFVESAGARAVPIVWRDSDEDILDLVQNLNGALFPGGSTALRNEDGSLTEHSRKIELVLNKVKELNDQGVYFPILSICMGFQEIVQSEAPYKDTVELNKFDSMNVANNLTLKYSIEDSKLFSEMPQHLINALQNENITYNHHHDGVYPSALNKYPALREGYYLLGTSYDLNGVEYVAFIESKEYPIWGIQFHPEMNIFIWKPTLEVPHSQVSIDFSQFMANFFVKQSKKNFNKFDSEEEAFDHMIEHIPVELNPLKKHEVYIFPG
ncbi:unnamed protein product [Moneuplotes crassus]|uniref:folate gamma-glutamyl hydrolase n=1 Tax=Euplotes crassus TaxID=5936 RepID=A0AAD1UNU3_EUPCR|nr:unnamed protein product [Moneuplotes crassus]